MARIGGDAPEGYTDQIEPTWGWTRSDILAKVVLEVELAIVSWQEWVELCSYVDTYKQPPLAHYDTFGRGV